MNYYTILFLGALAFCQLWVCQGSFLDEPQVKWTYNLPGSGTLAGRGLRSGNEVLSSPDGIILFATADDGSLHIIDANQPRDSVVFEPTQIAGTYTECRSGVTLVLDPDTEDIQYAVYAVIDVPVKAGVLYDGVDYDANRSYTLSRLLAVNLDGTLRFSVALNGVVVGKPVASRDGNKIYVVHNVPNTYASSSSPTRGQVSVIDAGRTSPIVTASLSALNQPGPFGPPTGTTTSSGGKVQDVIVVAEVWDSGYSTTSGKVYMLRPSSLYDTFNGQGNDAYQLQMISDLSVSSYARPATTAGAAEIFVGTAGAGLKAIAGSNNNFISSWTVQLDTNKGNASQPLMVAPTLSFDESYAYQVGASTLMYCIETKSGKTIWKSEGAYRGAISAEPRLLEVLPEEPKLYVIEGMNGKVRQHDALSGDIEWSFDCSTSAGTCNDAVQADFSVSPSGNYLYYGDIFGKIVALEIASFKPVTNQPTAKPTAKPTPAPTKAAIAEPEPEPETEPEEELVVPAPAEVEESSSTEYPTWSPVVEVTPSPVANSQPSPDIDSVPYDEALEEEEDEEDEFGLQYPTNLIPGDEREQSDSELSASNAVDGDKETKSFFSNEIMVILVAVCGGLALAIAVILIAQKARKMKNNKTKPSSVEEHKPAEDEVKDWGEAQDAYEEACRRDEEETLREIVNQSAKTPTKGKRSSKKKGRMSPMTPSTLASIEEVPGENELSFVSDTAPKNLEKSFDKSVEPSTMLKAMGIDTEKQDSNSVSRESDCPPELTGVEVVSKSVVSTATPTKETRYTMSSQGPAPELTDCGNDLMSVDGSLYLDDDSYLQGSKFDVASLSQFSMASTAENNSEMGSYYPGDEGSIRYEPAHGPGDNYMKPPRVASPLMQRNLSPQVADYLRQNESTMPPNPMTPRTAYVDSDPATTSPMTPPSGGSGTDVDRDAARNGQSARAGFFGRWDSKNRSRSPSPPRPPVDTSAETEEEPEDAWTSFLSELARAEREFFNPSMKKKTVPEERPSSPPPPPPPSYPPPDSAQGANQPPPPPPDPPAGSKHRTMLL